LAKNKQRAIKVVARLAAIQLQLNAAPQLLVVDVAKNVNRFDGSAERGQRIGQPLNYHIHRDETGDAILRQGSTLLPV